ncbi:Ubiquitin carboxyl-terminal hydrolase 10 [Hypsibius exemplaris]|uniref:Ubiquitin carboxyl-terminal hydrolase n=1 Tax=Hypsibius exemplaris TaxID=2072580 RepID=A0A9X6NNA7_HYPEX|nr:Ubiquitin carboxyl-terminal hydrolase 10 [Hypsibius exemplaris]
MAETLPSTLPPPTSLTTPHSTTTDVDAPISEKLVEAVIPEPVKKSWASLVKPKDDGKSQTPAAAAGAPNMMAFVETSEEMEKRKAMRKFERLGEIIFSRNLLDRKLDHRTVYLVPRGMINMGNTCYMNAVLQTLVFCPPFFHLLEALNVYSDTVDRPAAELPPIVDCFVQLVQSFRRIPNTGAKGANLRTEDPPLDPSFVYETFEEHATGAHKQMLSRGTQEDAQESLNHILLLLHEEMVKAMAALTDNPNSQFNRNGGGRNSGDEWTSISKGQKKSTLRECEEKESPLTYVFGGRLRSVRRHKGARDAENVEPFFMLDLPIQDPRVTNVFQAIERFMGIETLHGFQDRGRAVDAHRQYRFEELPAVLIIHLKYFEYTSTGGNAKLQKDITFEPTLRLPERWFADRHYNKSKSMYRLVSVIFHYGEGTDGGHYTACLFHPSSQTGWIEANDSTISVVSFDYMKQQQYHRVPYLLFYRLQEERL